MAVYRLFKNEAFEPEAISTMSDAYAEICRLLGASASRETDLVARTVIEFAQRGARDPIRLRACVLRALASDPDFAAGAGPSQGCAARHVGL